MMKIGCRDRLAEDIAEPKVSKQQIYMTDTCIVQTKPCKTNHNIRTLSIIDLFYRNYK